MNDALAASYRHCNAATREASSNFGFTFLLLPTEKRRAMCALYAYLRHTDDLADNDLVGAHAGKSALSATEILTEKRRRLHSWRDSLTAALEGRYDNHLFLALHDVVARYDIDREHLLAPIEGALLDLEKTRYETIDQLNHYCDLVASSVGMACMSIWGYRDTAARDAAHEPALACGRAFQLTNILRDVGEDAARNRIYLPAEDLEQCGVSEADLLARHCDTNLTSLVRFEVDRTERLYDCACDLWPLLTDDGRRVLTAMLGAYRALLAQIKSSPERVFGPAVSVSRPKKLAIAAAAVAGRQPTRGIAKLSSDTPARVSGGSH